MSDVPVFFSLGDDNEYWTGIPRERALEWTSTFLRRRPSVPATMMRLVAPNLAKGIPAGFTDWARRAQVAEAIGFTPERYEVLQDELDRIDPAGFPNHPDNHLDTSGLQPVRPFDAERWASWNRRLDEDGVDPTEELLRLELRPPVPLPEDELGRTIDLADYSFLSPVVLHAPHAGTRVPLSALDAFTVDRDALVEEQRLLADHATDRMTQLAGVHSRIAAGLSRLVVDVERFPDDREEMAAVGMGALYTHGSHRQPIRSLTDAERAPLLAYFEAYGELFATLVDRVLEQQGRAVILDVHSYGTAPLPYELHGADRRPELCIGVDPDHTPPALVDAVREAFDGWDVAIDEPFRGTYVPLQNLGDRRVSSVMLEIRRDRYLDEDGTTIDAAVRDIAGRIRTIAARVSRSE